MLFKVIHLGLLPVLIIIAICECKQSVHKSMILNDLKSCHDCDFKVLYHDMPKTRCYTAAQRYVKVIFLVNKQVRFDISFTSIHGRIYSFPSLTIWSM